jgi:uncharacterized protein (DUF736 family)
MSNKTKMYTTNTRARAWLVANGFKDIHFFPHLRFQKDVHFVGLGWDGFASYGKQMAMFQVKTNNACTKKVQEIMKKGSEESGVILMWINAKKRQKDLDITISPKGLIQLNLTEVQK